MKLHRAGLALLAGSVSLVACTTRAPREALRSCSFSPKGVQARTVGDSVLLELAMEIRNPGPTKAVLDSFSVLAIGDSPLARLSHGTTRTIEPGGTDTARIEVVVLRTSLLQTAMMLSLSPPDSLRLEGSAWIPRWFGGYSRHPVRVAVPYSRVSDQVRSLMPRF